MDPDPEEDKEGEEGIPYLKECSPLEIPGDGIFCLYVKIGLNCVKRWSTSCELLSCRLAGYSFFEEKGQNEIEPLAPSGQFFEKWE